MFDQLSGCPFRSGLKAVGAACKADFVVPTAEEIAAIPAENLHISRAEFAAVWTAAELLADEQEARHAGSWHTTAVVVTCRWVGRAIIKPATGRWYEAYASVTRTRRMAYAELIERDCLAAEVQSARRPVSPFLQERRGWTEGIAATFAWMWRRPGPAPIAVDRSVSGPAAT